MIKKITKRNYTGGVNEFQWGIFSKFQEYRLKKTTPLISLKYFFGRTKILITDEHVVGIVCGLAILGMLTMMLFPAVYNAILSVMMYLFVDREALQWTVDYYARIRSLGLVTTTLLMFLFNVMLIYVLLYMVSLITYLVSFVIYIVRNIMIVNDDIIKR